MTRSSFVWPPPKDAASGTQNNEHSENNEDSFSWPPAPNRGRPDRPFRPPSASPMSSPQKITARKMNTSRSSTTDITPMNESGDVPRMQLFESKAEVKYLDDDDDFAARVYGDRDSKKSQRAQSMTMKQGVSGYDFGALLKDEKVEYNPWGQNSCRF